MSQNFHGIIPAVATPFDERFAVDKATLRELIEWYLASGVHGISVCGSQGEFFSLNHDEQISIIETAVRTVDGRVPIYAGTGAVTTQESIQLTKAAEKIGADISLVITPYFLSPSADELVMHYREITKSTKLPVMIYNNPPRTGVNVTPTIYRRCLEDANVVGIKDSSGDITQICEYIEAGAQKKLLFAGRDTVILSTVLHGGSGAISPAANVFPGLVVRLYSAIRENNIEEAGRLHNILLPLRKAWALGSFPVVIKEAMSLVGRSAGPTRPPIQALGPDAKAKLTKVITTIQAADKAAQDNIAA